MIRSIKHSKVWRGLTFLMLINFINLSANFYHASEIDSLMLEHQDPIDSLAELVLEYFLNMDEEIIPDTEIPHEKRKLGDIKQLYFTNLFSYCIRIPSKTDENHSHYRNFYQNLIFDISSPPPKHV